MVIIHTLDHVVGKLLFKYIKCPSPRCKILYSEFIKPTIKIVSASRPQVWTNTKQNVIQKNLCDLFSS